MIKWIRTSRLSIKDSLSVPPTRGLGRPRRGAAPLAGRRAGSPTARADARAGRLAARGGDILRNKEGAGGYYLAGVVD